MQQPPFVRDAPLPPRQGNRVRPLIDGVPAFTRICAAVDAAEHSVYATIAFIHDDFVMPEGFGSLFDVLDRAQERGLDVRVLFWRSNPGDGVDERRHFSGTPEHRAMLRRRGSTWGIRWDRAGEAVCHHQKSWIVDAGRPGEVAFVGGINLNPGAMAHPGHRDGGHHDVFVEIAGPGAGDVHRNFVERWNAASDRDAPDGSWGRRGALPVELPAGTAKPRGESVVQIQRTLRATGERTIYTQYLLAIDAAERTIYLENQALEHPGIVARLDAALERGVAVVALVPSEPEPAVRAVRAGRQLPEAEAFFRQLAALGRHERFVMAGIAAPGRSGQRRPVYVHAKLMLVDDVFATIGSCNLRARSFFRHTELNASLYDPVVVRALRAELFDEHLGIDTSSWRDAAALALFSTTARENATTSDAWQGNAFALDPASYAT